VACLVFAIEEQLLQGRDNGSQTLVLTYLNDRHSARLPFSNCSSKFRGLQFGKIQDLVDCEQANTKAAAVAAATPTSGTATEASIATPAAPTYYIHTSEIKNRKVKSAIARWIISCRGLHVRVHFNVDAKDHVREEVFTYEKVPEDFKSNRFWSKRD
jgi:hypothetical protein